MAFSSWRTWVTGEVVTAAHMNQEIRDNGEALFPDENAGVAWAPDLEGTTSGSVTGAGRRFRIGPLQFVWARFTGFGDEADKVTGTYFVALPVAASGVVSSSSSGAGQALGSWQGRHETALSLNEGGAVVLRSASSVMFQRPVGGIVTHSSPVTWASGTLSFHAVYPVA